ncbi:MAG TPA: hypothetical protein VGJ56_31735 [Reyranella sp.]|jgi:hypothetical protein
MVLRGGVEPPDTAIFRYTCKPDWFRVHPDRRWQTGKRVAIALKRYSRRSGDRQFAAYEAMGSCQIVRAPAHYRPGEAQELPAGRFRQGNDIQ